MTLGDKEFMKTNIILDNKYLFKKKDIRRSARRPEDIFDKSNVRIFKENEKKKMRDVYT